MTEQPFVLDAYAARSCELKTANAFTPGLTAPSVEFRPPPFFHDADAVEADVFGRLRAHVGSYVDLRVLRGAPSEEQEAAALRSLAEGIDLIVGPLLPRDWAGHRAGRPSLLLRRGDGYVPVLVKFHRVLESCSLEDAPLSYSILDEPLAVRELPGRRFRWGGRLNAALQVAHHWRLLEATGHAASEPWAGLIGTERLVPADADSRRQHLAITWLDLSAAVVAPSPESVPEPEAAVPVSTLERYDFEQGHRARLAAAALGGDGWVPPEPVMHRECAYCVWAQVCAARLPDDDLSKRINKAPLDVHEVKTLRELGVRSVGDLASADVDALLERYLPRVSHRDGGEIRLRLAQRRARLIVSGAELERTSFGSVDVAEHELEIDLDIETSADDYAYLWGFHVDDRASGARGYRAFSRFAPLDAAGERELAAEAFEWLRTVTTGRDAVVYHYSDYETLRITRLAGQLRERGAGELADWIDAFATEQFVDMFPLVKAHFFGANGLGLKVVASAGAGFHWRDEEPGGLASQSWFEAAVNGGTVEERDAARTRVLEYNEDDVLATWNLRRWLRSLD